ncbi:MAG TPA: hypothetical protein VKH63_16725 [Candidatus Acidoferrum sp.]|jgi:hypothetical protein|nr:hypothetical protein [Candidatus Acidoferrum sp.]
MSTGKVRKLRLAAPSLDPPVTLFSPPGTAHKATFRLGSIRGLQ